MTTTKAMTVALALAAAALFFACDEAPLEATGQGWTELGRVPGSVLKWVSGMCQLTAHVVIVGQVDTGTEEPRARVVDYYRGEFITLYECPPGTELYDIGGSEEHLWAFGVKLVNDDYEPYVLSGTLRQPDDWEWVEKPATGWPKGGAIAVYPFTGEKGMVLVSESYSGFGGEVPRVGFVGTYYGASFVPHYGLGYVSLAISPGGSYAYAVEEVSDEEDINVYISDDEGAGWVTETVPRYVAPGYRVTDAYAGDAVGQCVYLLATFDRGSGIIKRIGPPGAGEYKLVFYCPVNPYFNALTLFAYRRDDGQGYGITNDAVATGEVTSVAYREGEYRLEALGCPYFFKEIRGAYNAPGFFALARDFAGYDFVLLYHP